MSDNERYSGDPRAGGEPIHAAGGMGEPAAATGGSADAADIASTDMDANPSNAPPVEAAYAGPHTGVPVEPAPAAIRRLEDEVADLRDKHLRLAAEFDNYRKRVARERNELSERAQAALVTRLLDVLDDMDRIVAAGGAGDAVREAMVLVDKKLRKELEAAGVERLDPVGQPFDPSQHEAVSTIPAPDPAQDHVVSATFQTGYRFKGQLVRPARVQVYSTHGAG
ncbi:MAG TPA: nucleotide exchange factor GrpE [Gemmatimonadales bacterium]|nr:nucleotide exchange factor GrpE [Gemmatimonadales bacterium]